MPNVHPTHGVPDGHASYAVSPILVSIEHILVSSIKLLPRGPATRHPIVTPLRLANCTTASIEHRL